MTVLYVIIALAILAAVGFGILKIRQKKAADKAEKVLAEQALIDKFKAENPGMTFKDWLAKKQGQLK